MTGWRHCLALLREVVATCRASLVTSVTTLVMVAGVCASVLLTNGRTVTAQQQALGVLDAAGTRTIVVSGTPDAGLDSGLLKRVSVVEGVSRALALGPVIDATNSRAPRDYVGVRHVWTIRLRDLGFPTDSPAGAAAWASEDALVDLGMPDATGSVTTTDGTDYPVVGVLEAPDDLAFLEPLVLVPEKADAVGTVTTVVVVASDPSFVGSLTAFLQADIASLQLDPKKVEIATRSNLASIRGTLEQGLIESGRGLVAMILVSTALLLGVIQYALVMIRRKEYGRRRAPGASRSLIVTLVLLQTALLAAVGAIVGTVGAVMALTIGGSPLPGFGYLIAVGVLACATAVAGAVVPAVAASRRDPLTELRVP